MPIKFNRDVLPPAFSTITNDRLVADIHEVYFGPRLTAATDSATGSRANRTYNCVACDRTYAAPQRDSRLHARVEHVLNKHKDWPEVVLRHYISKSQNMVADPLADAYRLAFTVLSRLRAPFAYVESHLFRSITKFTTPMYRTAITNAGDTLARAIRIHVSAQMPDVFGLVFDGWKGPQAYFLGVYAVWPENDKPKFAFLAIRSFKSVTGANAELADDSPESLPEVDENSDIHSVATSGRSTPVGLEVYTEPEDDSTPTLASFQCTADAHVALLTEILGDFAKGWNNVGFLVGDNSPLNRSVARKTNRPMVGCYAHLLNLGCKRYFAQHDVIFKKVYKLMGKLRGRETLRRYVQHWTGEIPKVMGRTRWRSMIQMLDSYLRIRYNIPFDQAADILPYKLTGVEDEIVDIVLWEAKTELLTVFDLLDSAESTLGLARSWFDVLLAKPSYQQVMHDYLSIDTPLLTVQSKAFVTAVANLSLPLSKQRPLTPEEADAMSMFRNDTETPAVGPFRRTLDDPVPFPSMAWVPATSCVVERLFSVARNMLPYNRLSIHSKNFENQLLVGIFDSSIKVGDMEARSLNPIDSIANATASISLN